MILTELPAGLRAPIGEDRYGRGIARLLIEAGPTDIKDRRDRER
jgi:hypothetical protein